MIKIVAAAVICFTTVSCSQRNHEAPYLPETPVLSGGLGWALIHMAYIPINESASSASPAIGTARRGDIGKVTARSRSFDGADTGVWYKVQIGTTDGWLYERALSVYKTEAEARKAQEKTK